MTKNKLVSVFPCLSLVQNTGHDGSGEHCGKNEFYQNQSKHDEFIPLNFPNEVFIDNEIKLEMKKYTSSSLKNSIKAKLKLLYLQTRFLLKY